MFRHVTLPAIAPVLAFLLLWQLIQAVQLFDLVYGSTRGGPGQSTVVVVYYIYRSIRDSAYGMGAAASYARRRLADGRSPRWPCWPRRRSRRG